MPRLAAILARAPFGRDKALLLEFQQDWVQGSLVDRKKISADLVDPPGNPVAMGGPVRPES